MSKTKMTSTAKSYAAELKDLIASLHETVIEAKSPEESWDAVDRFQKDVLNLRKSIAEIPEEMDGHTRHLQGLDLPIMVNSVCDSKGNWFPSEVSEMHIGKVDGKEMLLITPLEISIP